MGVQDLGLRHVGLGEPRRQHVARELEVLGVRTSRNRTRSQAAAGDRAVGAAGRTRSPAEPIRARSDERLRARDGPSGWRGPRKRRPEHQGDVAASVKPCRSAAQPAGAGRPRVLGEERDMVALSPAPSAGCACGRSELALRDLDHAGAVGAGERGRAVGRPESMTSSSTGRSTSWASTAASTSSRSGPPLRTGNATVTWQASTANL